ncbi:unnamed protein product [Musa banksii]
MASESKDSLPLRPTDSTSAAVHPSTTSSSAGDRKVKLLCSYGGRILPRLSDGALRYAGGETRIITVCRDSTLPEILRRMSEAFAGPIVLRYQLPGEDLDALISVSTAEDLENMMEECDKLAAESPSTKLRVFLFSPSDVTGAAVNPLDPYLDLQDTGARYLEAVNGLDSSIRRKDSVTSFSSTQNSDGMMAAAEVIVNEGTSAHHVSPRATSAQDASESVFAAQDVQELLPPTSSTDQTQFLNSTQSESPPVVPNQSSIAHPTQAELTSVMQYVPQQFVDPQQAQMLNAQSYLVMGSPRPINVVAVPPHGYVPPAHISTPSSQVSNGTSVQTRVDPHTEIPNGGKTVKLHGDAKLQPLSQLPPLPPPHLLVPHAERNVLHQVPSASQRLSMRLGECSLCQRALPHVHSDTLIYDQDNGLKNAAIPEVNMALQSHHSEDLTRMRAPQIVDARTPVDSWVETQAKNLLAAAPSVTYEFTETIPEMPRDAGRPVLNAANPDHAKVLVPPVPVGLPSTSQAACGTITNPEKYCQEDSSQKQQEVPPNLSPNMENLDHSNVVHTPASLALPHNPYGTLFPPQFHGENASQQQIQFAQHIGYPKYPVNQDFIAKPFAADANLVGNSQFREDGQSVQGTVPAIFYGYIRPMEGMTRAIYTNTPGQPDFNDWPRPVVMPDIGTSKDLKPAERPLIEVNTHTTGSQDRGNEWSLSNPLISPVFVAEGNAGVLVDQQPSAVKDVAYLHGVKPANTSHVPNMIGNHGPYAYHLETGVGPRGMSKYVDLTDNNSAFNKNPSSAHKDEAPNTHPADILGDTTILQNDNAQFCTIHHTISMDQLQQAVSSDPLISNKDPQKTLGSSSVLPPRPSNVSSKEAKAMKPLNNKNYPLNSTRSEITVPPEEVSCCLPHSSNTDLPTEPAHLLKDLEGVNINQDIQTFEERPSTSALKSSEVPSPVIISHETKETDPRSGNENGTIENNIVIDDDQTEVTKAKPSEKVKNGFPNTDEIGHLQVIKNSDLEELQELGAGAFGTVYHGKWRGTDVAIKRINDRVFSGKPSEQERARADFWNEACKLASLHHPNVVAFYGIVLDGPGGSVATVTEFMVNGSLRRVLQKNEKVLDRYRSLIIAMDVAFGMEYLHSKNIIHFDLKSDNLLVNLRDPQRPICKVGDLGLSKVKYETLMSGGMRGTLPWMAPELLGGKDNKYTEKVDVFSFGIVMWELITGEEPYGDMHYGAIIGGILNDTLRPPVPESCDAEWRSLMEQCWATEPSQRPSFTEIASRLRAMAASLPQKG